MAGLDVEAGLNSHLMMVVGIAKVRSQIFNLVAIVSSVVQFGIRVCGVECDDVFFDKGSINI